MRLVQGLRHPAHRMCLGLILPRQLAQRQQNISMSLAGPILTDYGSMDLFLAISSR